MRIGAGGCAGSSRVILKASGYAGGAGPLRTGAAPSAISNLASSGYSGACRGICIPGICIQVNLVSVAIIMRERLLAAERTVNFAGQEGTWGK